MWVGSWKLSPNMAESKLETSESFSITSKSGLQIGLKSNNLEIFYDQQNGSTGKAPASKPDDLNLIPGTHLEEENTFSHVCKCT